MPRRPLLALALALSACHHAPAPGPATRPAPRPAAALPCDHPLSVAEAQGKPDGESVCLAGFLCQLAEPCPPCPPRARCEACLPPYPRLCDDPPSVTDPAGAWAWVAGLDASARIGDRLTIAGAFEQRGSNRLFLVTPTP